MHMWILRKLWKSKLGEMQRVITICIALFVAGIILPVALGTLANATWTNVDPAVKTVCTVLLPILAVISIVYVFIKRR